MYNDIDPFIFAHFGDVIYAVSLPLSFFFFLLLL
jgi:hypothetical protein